MRLFRNIIEYYVVARQPAAAMAESPGAGDAIQAFNISAADSPLAKPAADDMSATPRPPPQRKFLEETSKPLAVSSSEDEDEGGGGEIDLDTSALGLAAMGESPGFGQISPVPGPTHAEAGPADFGDGVQPDSTQRELTEADLAKAALGPAVAPKPTEAAPEAEADVPESGAEEPAAAAEPPGEPGAEEPEPAAEPGAEPAAEAAVEAAVEAAAAASGAAPGAAAGAAGAAAGAAGAEAAAAEVQAGVAATPKPTADPFAEARPDKIAMLKRARWKNPRRGSVFDLSAQGGHNGARYHTCPLLCRSACCWQPTAV